jgi:type IV pilus assembly protein PilA
MFFSNKAKGFTLIELLVVVAIIGVMSSIVMSSLNSARKKSNDAALKTQVKQFQTLLNLEYSETGSYSALQPNQWFPSGGSCSSYFTGNYAVKAQEVCQKMLDLSGNWFNSGSNLYRVYIGNTTSTSSRYSITAQMNSTNTAFCVGSSGISSTDTGGWNSLGCLLNP